MRAVLLGTGSPPPNPKRRGPATLLTLGEEMFLVDAGSGVGAQLVQAGVRPYDWPRVLITHHHSDHIIDLGHLLITRWISGQNAPFEVWGPAGTQRQMDKLLDYLDWDIEIRRHHMVKRARPTVRVTEIEEARSSRWAGSRSAPSPWTTIPSVRPSAIASRAAAGAWPSRAIRGRRRTSSGGAAAWIVSSTNAAR